MLIDETFRRVMLATQIRLGRLTAKSCPLASMLRVEVMLATCVLSVCRRLLLLTSKVCTVIKLIPSRELKKVLLMVTLSAWETVAGKVRRDRAGNADQSIVLTEVSSVMERVDRRVKLNKLKVPPMEPMVELPRLVNWPAFSQMKSPVICSGPSMLISPAASALTRTSPEMVVHAAYCVASACELIVAVAWEQMEAVWAKVRQIDGQQGWSSNK
jgi:hypothetical protein